MKAVAVNGSPRKDGNTHTLLSKILEPIAESGWETEIIQIGGKPMRGCLACRRCYEKQDKKCVITEDSFNDCMAKLIEADAIILGSPTYFTDVTSEMKALIDRAGSVSMANGRIFSGKIGAAAVAVRRGGATHTFDSINHLFLITGMIVPGSTYWNFCVGREKGEVSGDLEGMANMMNLGKTIAWLGNAIKPHLADYPKAATRK
ncbi:MAG: flavodoxin family protein [Candidatus Riflebacteria bacterium]|nr:flavodoxin family protein [Candidatus Riflebacteria bacterium]